MGKTKEFYGQLMENNIDIELENHFLEQEHENFIRNNDPTKGADSRD